MFPKEMSDKHERLKIVRQRLETSFKKYFDDLCQFSDLNKNGNFYLNTYSVTPYSKS